VIIFVEGSPGSGKTYYVMHHLLETYYEWCARTDRWTPKSAVRVFTNIDACRVGESLDDAVRAAGGIHRFFTMEYQRRLKGDQDAQLVYVIDEVQRFFPRDFGKRKEDVGAKDVLTFWQMHRHLGVSAYLVTQDLKTVVLELRVLSEYLVRAARRTMSVFGEFWYTYHGDERAKAWRKKRLSRDQRVFSAYRSMSGLEAERVSSAPLRWLAIMGAILALTALVWWWFLTGFRWTKGYAGSGRVEAATVARSAPAFEAGQATLDVLDRGDGRELAELPRTRRYVLVGVAGDEDAGRVWLEDEDGGQHQALASVVIDGCRCNVFARRAGSMLELAPGTMLTPLRRAARHGAERSGAPMRRRRVRVKRAAGSQLARISLKR
jgi:hypothetical protein